MIGMVKKKRRTIANKLQNSVSVSGGINVGSFTKISAITAFTWSILHGAAVPSLAYLLKYVISVAKGLSVKTKFKWCEISVVVTFAVDNHDC